MKRLVLLAALLAPGCYNPGIPSAMLGCSADGRCPSGFYCAPDNHCWKPGDAALGKMPARATGSLVGGASAMQSSSYRMVGALNASGSGSPKSNGFAIVDGVSGSWRTK